MGGGLTTILFTNETEARRAAREEGYEDQRNPFEMTNRGSTIRLVPERERAYGTGKILGWRWMDVR